MNLTKDFTLEEMTASIVAANKNINNVPSKEIVENLKTLCKEVLQPLRDKLNKPVTINSGYRSPELNKAISGATNSQHLSGQAADITMGDKKSNRLLFDTIKQLGKYDQLIDEKDFQWVHVSYKQASNRLQELHLKRFNY
jgi:uncharacterized protein YcbK (DUF882 family)